MVKFGRKLELINVQQPGKKEVNKVLKQEALNKLFRSVYLAKKTGKKHVTSKEIEITLKE
jgi:hypothetical protein